MGTFGVDFGSRRSRASVGSIDYRLDVIAAGLADVVGSVGGWLCDRARAGWNVTVLLPQSCDPRPLQILGVQTAVLDTPALPATTEYAARCLAVSAEMYAAEPGIAGAVHRALDRSRTEVILWQDNWSQTVRRQTTPVRHVLSDAARAFKQHALTATGIPGVAGPTEALLGDTSVTLPVESELIPVG